MKCEICRKLDAEKAIEKVVNGVKEELYVCSRCAAEERRLRQSRKAVAGNSHKHKLPPGVSISVSGPISAPPPFIDAILNALEGVAGKITGATEEKPEEKAARLKTYSNIDDDAKYCYGEFLHLEGLYLVGDLDAVKRAFIALGCELEGITLSGVKDCGHLYKVKYPASLKDIRRIVQDLLVQEGNARYHITEVEPRTLGDTVCRSLSLLKSCRLLSPGEFLDMLSPLRLAALGKFLEGMELSALEDLMNEIEFGKPEFQQDEHERYRVDGERADEINRLFRDVILSEEGEERLT